MLDIRNLDDLATALGIPLSTIKIVSAKPAPYVREYELVSPSKPVKRRNVISVRRELREIQRRLYKRVLQTHLRPLGCSHGSVSGKSIKTNLRPHRESRYAWTADIADFFPSINYRRVYRLFKERLGCSVPVARLLTPLCTYNHHLALGLPTSPILADQILGVADRRVMAVCESAGAVYTRFVDDITISAPFNVSKTGISDIVKSILTKHGFKMKANKELSGRLDRGFPVTGIRLNRGHPDVTREFYDRLSSLLNDARHLADGQQISGEFYTRQQILGKVQFACWVNPGRRNLLGRELKSIPWDNHAHWARHYGYIQEMPCLVAVS